MSDSDHTRVSDFEQVEHWGDLRTLQERRFYLRRLVRVESDNLIRQSIDIAPGGFDDDTSNLFVVNEKIMSGLLNCNDLIKEKVWPLPPDLIFHSPEWGILQQSMPLLSREFKIHIQPEEIYIPEVVTQLAHLIVEDKFLQHNIGCFKCKVIFQNQLPRYNRAIIIIYLALRTKRQAARDMCRQVVAKLKAGLADFEDCNNGKLPIYNYPVTKLISLIQVGTDTKFKLRKILGEARFNQLFPAKFHQALLMDEKIEYYL
jgi:hypothetical protein